MKLAVPLIHFGFIFSVLFLENPTHLDFTCLLTTKDIHLLKLGLLGLLVESPQVVMKAVVERVHQFGVISDEGLEILQREPKVEEVNIQLIALRLLLVDVVDILLHQDINVGHLEFNPVSIHHEGQIASESSLRHSVGANHALTGEHHVDALGPNSIAGCSNVGSVGRL